MPIWPIPIAPTFQGKGKGWSRDNDWAQKPGRAWRQVFEGLSLDELPEGFFQAFGRQQKLGKSKLGEDQNHHRRRSAGEKCCSLKDLGKLGPYNIEVS